MNIIRRYSTRIIQSPIKFSPSLNVAIESFIDRVKFEQSKSCGPVLKAIDLLVDTHYDVLIKRLGLKDISNPYDTRQAIYDKLSKYQISNTIEQEVLARRHELQQQNKNTLTISKKYQRFIKELYSPNKPSRFLFESESKDFDIVKNAQKFTHHHQLRLYQSYMQLPSPAPLYMTAEDLNTLIEKFVMNVQIHMPHSVLRGALSQQNPEIGAGYLANKLRDRQEYVSMCSKILQDIKSAGLPLTENEQIRFALLSFYRDNKRVSDFYEKYRNENDPEYPKFNFEIYKELVNSLPRHPKSGDFNKHAFGVLMFHAIRHDQWEIIQDLLKTNPGSTDILCDDDTRHKISLRTGSMLLEYFEVNIDRPGNVEYLARVLDYITQGYRFINHALVNRVITMLINTGKMEYAERLLKEAYFSPNQLEQQQQQEQENQYSIESPEEKVARQLSKEDRNLDTEWNIIYRNLKLITQDTTVFYNLSVTSRTFYNLIEHYCNQKDTSFSRLKLMLKIITDHAKLPIYTNIYQLIYDGFILRSNDPDISDWTIQDLLELTTQLIGESESSAQTMEDTQKTITQLLHAGRVSMREFNDVLRSSLQEQEKNKRKEKTRVPIRHSMMLTIFQAFENTIWRYLQTTGDNRYKEILNMVEGHQHEYLRAVDFWTVEDRRNPYVRERSTATRRVYLLELVQMVSQALDGGRRTIPGSAE
ncbi:uncharacterized protein J8A68_000356 [[Candida] subhashii]|uniref:Uncharacterized protein n=1 Tax=[Candida] subhashii TaxID=561895 RepID=A0A8J5R780_9ASCO|nr:uncharacterized protein J8A68_000356 [[Candida] subhashii]KAG7666100.1 hypothetical protein J8A68_000356 [[Candida] subhashii]